DGIRDIGVWSSDVCSSDLESLGTHWLLWAVCATELGYDYEGEEYWPTFAKKTPGWGSDLSRRDYVRRWFHRFHVKYAGFQPSGRSEERRVGKEGDGGW